MQAVNLTETRGLDGKILVYAANYNNNYRGYAYFWDATCDNLLHTVQFSADPIDRLVAASLSDGSSAIAYKDTRHSPGRITFFGADGYLADRTLTFSEYDPQYISMAALDNSRLALAYRTNEDPSCCGTLLWGGNYRLTLEKRSSNEVWLHNYTAETLTLSLSLDQ